MWSMLDSDCEALKVVELDLNWTLAMKRYEIKQVKTQPGMSREESMREYVQLWLSVMKDEKTRQYNIHQSALPMELP